LNKKILILFVVFATVVVFTFGCSGIASAGVSNIRMTNDSDGKNVTKTFASSDVIYAFFDVNQVDEGATFQVKSYALNVAGQNPATPFLVTDYSYNGESTIYVQIENAAGTYPVGQYKVEIDLNGIKVGEAQFTIQ